MLASCEVLDSLFAQLPTLFWMQPNPMALSMHFDESGIHAGSPIICVAGYLAESGRWASFDAEWRTIIAELNSHLAWPMKHFHMTKFVGDFDAYRPLRELPELKTLILIKITDCIRRHAQASFSVSFRPDDYKDIFGLGDSEWPSPAYEFALQNCFYLVGAWAKREAIKDNIVYVMERNNEFRPHAEMILDALVANPQTKMFLKHSDHVFVTKDNSPGCQAADVIAYETFRMWRTLISKEPEPKWHVMPGSLGPRHIAYYLKREGIEGASVDSLKLNFPEIPEHASTLGQIEEFFRARDGALPNGEKRDDEAAHGND